MIGYLEGRDFTNCSMSDFNLTHISILVVLNLIFLFKSTETVRINESSNKSAKNWNEKTNNHWPCCLATPNCLLVISARAPSPRPAASPEKAENFLHFNYNPATKLFLQNDWCSFDVWCFNYVQCIVIIIILLEIAWCP